jgi:hypothetical protein
MPTPDVDDYLRELFKDIRARRKTAPTLNESMSIKEFRAELEAADSATRADMIVGLVSPLEPVLSIRILVPGESTPPKRKKKKGKQKRK